MFCVMFILFLLFDALKYFIRNKRYLVVWSGSIQINFNQPTNFESIFPKKKCYRLQKVCYVGK